jgi:hypothetical protein
VTGSFLLFRTDYLPDEDEVDAAGILLVDLEDLPDATVLAVGRNGTGVLERQAATRLRRGTPRAYPSSTRAFHGRDGAP